MYRHHEETIKNISEKLRKRDDVLGLLIGGSIAHGYETEISDVDIMILVSNENYNIRLKSGDMHYWENESCTYKDGYIDGKYICLDFLQKVAECGIFRFLRLYTHNIYEKSLFNSFSSINSLSLCAVS